MNLIDLVAVLALLQLLFFGTLVGQARGKYGVKAPAVSGAEPFERLYRVQMNTTELMVMLLPALYICGKYWSASLVAGLGAVYLIGRLVYWRAYVAAPSKRGLGFLLSAGPIIILLLGALAGGLGLVKL